MEITADSTTLLRQASMTAAEYLDRAVENIDTALGDGYAKNHPELIGAFMQAAAIDMGTAIIAKCVGTAIEEVSSAITAADPSPALERIADAIIDADPSPALTRIAEAVQNITAMIHMKLGGR